MLGEGSQGPSFWSLQNTSSPECLLPSEKVGLVEKSVVVVFESQKSLCM